MKSISVVNKIISTNLNIDPKTVEAVNKMYWKEVVINLINFAQEPIHIKRIGTIVVHPYFVYSNISVLIARIKKVRSSPKYKEATKSKMIEDCKGKLTVLLKERNKIAIKRYNGENIRIPKPYPQNYKEQRSNSGGNSELCKKEYETTT